MLQDPGMDKDSVDEATKVQGTEAIKDFVEWKSTGTHGPTDIVQRKRCKRGDKYVQQDQPPGHHLSPVRMAIARKTKGCEQGQGCREGGTLHPAGGRRDPEQTTNRTLPAGSFPYRKEPSLVRGLCLPVFLPVRRGQPCGCPPLTAQVQEVALTSH